MEYVDITFNGIEKKYIDYFVKCVMNIDCSKIVNSHFYTNERGDFEYYDDIDLKEYFSDNRTCNILLSGLRFNTEYGNVLVIITSNEQDIDITVNIEYDRFMPSLTKKFITELEQLFFKFQLKCITVISTIDNNPILIIDSKGTLCSYN